MSRHEDRRPWGLIVALALAATAGLASLPLQVVTYRNLDAASKADVARNAELTRQLADQQAADAASARRFREDSRRLTLAICTQIEAVAEQAGLEVPPCPRVATNPSPTPTGAVTGK